MAIMHVADALSMRNPSTSTLLWVSQIEASTIVEGDSIVQGTPDFLDTIPFRSPVLPS